jgi:hypothetical protein
VLARIARLTTLVNLYKDLGGGWIEHTGDPRTPAEDVGSLAPHNDAPWDLMDEIHRRRKTPQASLEWHD